MHSEIKYIVANLTGIPLILDAVFRRRPLVLAYHGIYDGSRRLETLPPTFVHADDLATQLEALTRSHRVLSPERFADYVYTNKPLPPRSALITFDDGYESFERLAAPILERLGLRAVVFVATHFVETMKPFWFDVAWCYARLQAAGGGTPLSENRLPLPSVAGGAEFMNALKAMALDARDLLVDEMKAILDACMTTFNEDLRLFYPLSPQSLKSLSDNGFAVGGHTHTHTILSTLPNEQAAAEIHRNSSCIENITGRRCRLFAYPNGGLGDFLPVHKEMLHLAGYTAAFSLTQRRSRPAVDPMEISRMNVAPEDSVRTLMFRACGTVPIKETLWKGA